MVKIKTTDEQDAQTIYQTISKALIRAAGEPVKQPVRRRGKDGPRTFDVETVTNDMKTNYHWRVYYRTSTGYQREWIYPVTQFCKAFVTYKLQQFHAAHDKGAVGLLLHCDNDLLDTVTIFVNSYY